MELNPHLLVFVFLTATPFGQHLLNLVHQGDSSETFNNAVFTVGAEKTPQVLAAPAPRVSPPEVTEDLWIDLGEITEEPSATSSSKMGKSFKLMEGIFQTSNFSGLVNSFLAIAHVVNVFSWLFRQIRSAYLSLKCGEKKKKELKIGIKREDGDEIQRTENNSLLFQKNRRYDDHHHHHQFHQHRSARHHSGYPNSSALRMYQHLPKHQSFPDFIPLEIDDGHQSPSFINDHDIDDDDHQFCIRRPASETGNKAVGSSCSLFNGAGSFFNDEAKTELDDDENCNATDEHTNLFDDDEATDVFPSKERLVPSLESLCNRPDYYKTCFIEDDSLSLFNHV